MWRHRENVTNPPNKLAEGGASKFSKLALQLKPGEVFKGGRGRTATGLTTTVIVKAVFIMIGVVARPAFVAVVAVIAVKALIGMFFVEAGPAAASAATMVVGGRVVPIGLHQ